MCFNPIQLKSGEIVPCGKCEECYQHRRNEWSVRLQLHTLAYDRMPLFVTLTYDNEHLPETGLRKKDVQDYIKRIRDKYNLYNTDFSFFGCGEFGDLLGRGHYHLLLFGMPFYNDCYVISDELCESVVKSDWRNGNAFVCVADWSGIHYCTKYCLKYLDRDWNDSQVSPFILCSKGIGVEFFNDPQFKFIRSCVNVARYREVLDSVPQLDLSTPHTILSTSNDLISRLKPFVESCKVTLPSGKQVPLPRYYRKRLFGSFEDWKDNPFAYYRYLQKMNRYASDAIRGFKKSSRILVKQQQIAKRMYQRGHLVQPSKNFNVR